VQIRVKILKEYTVLRRGDGMKRSKIILQSIILLSFLMILPGCGWLRTVKGWFSKVTGGARATDIVTISAEQLKAKMTKSLGLYVINVLSADHYRDCHIKGSLHASLDELKEAAAIWEKDQKIVVYCASYKCGASRKAYQILKKMGFTRVEAYEGGMKEWRKKGYPTVGVCEADYLR
jgi:rhodanese-related sulfurtransferase